MAPHNSDMRPGDCQDTDDNEARPDEMGSGPAHATGDPTSLGGAESLRHPSASRFDVEQERADAGDMETMEPTDGRLGLTNVGNVPPDDSAADTGETHTAEGEP